MCDYCPRYGLHQLILLSSIRLAFWRLWSTSLPFLHGVSVPLPGWTAWAALEASNDGLEARHLSLRDSDSSKRNAVYCPMESMMEAEFGGWRRLGALRVECLELDQESIGRSGPSSSGFHRPSTLTLICLVQLHTSPSHPPPPRRALWIPPELSSSSRAFRSDTHIATPHAPCSPDAPPPLPRPILNSVLLPSTTPSRSHALCDVVCRQTRITSKYPSPTFALDD